MNSFQSRWRAVTALALAAVASLLLAACSGGGPTSTTTDAITINGDVPIAYVKRSNKVVLNPTDGANGANGGDLMVRERASPSALEFNVSEKLTQGKGDVSDPEVSYDGKRIVFAMRCQFDNFVYVDRATGVLARTSTTPIDPQNPIIPGLLQGCTGRWNIWEYAMKDLSPEGLRNGVFRRITGTEFDDDVDPVYLPADRGIVFSSNRQATSSKNQALGKAYYATDEYERERVFNLHSMKLDGTGVQQISFNQSHDRNPVIRPNGDIMFSRWEHVGDRNRFAIFKSKPDGTDMFVLYGAQSAGNTYLNPRDMDPQGAYAGQLATALVPLARTQEGGDLRMIDVTRYSEDNTPVNSSIAKAGGQISMSTQALGEGNGLSLRGRATTPYPLWDGTDRVLVAWRPCQARRNEVLVPCALLTPDEVAFLQDTNRAANALDNGPLRDDAPASYAIYMFNPAQQTWLIVAAPPDGFMYTDPISLSARTAPKVVEPTPPDATLAAQGQALIEVRSVYDTDDLQRMGEQMLADADRKACAPGQPGIAMTISADPQDTRLRVPDIVRMKDPAEPAYRCTPVRFVRATRAVAPPAGATGARNAIGETDFEQQQILGYAPIEPDGSFKLQVPADTPLAFAVIDAEGRAFQTHTNWIQVRPGERRTCDGCHSPRRGAALNSGAVVNTLPAAWLPSLRAQHLSGETMASLRTRLDPAALKLSPTPVYTDIWADTSQPGIVARPSISLPYTGNANAADNLGSPAPTNGVINYPENIAPLWTRLRGPGGVNTCTRCHNTSGKLDLRSTVSGAGRLESYQELVLGDPLLDAKNNTQVRFVNGVPVIVRSPALVETSGSAFNTGGQARKSRLTEVMWGQTLLAGAEARKRFPGPTASAPDHSTMLNKAEKRLLAEWMDLGGQYYNDPFNSGSGVRTDPGLDVNVFVLTVNGILRGNCAGCHQAGTAVPNSRFILTGSFEGDYNGTLAVIDNVCDAGNNPLLKRPSTVPHPDAALGQTTALIPVGSADYNAIASWIASGCKP
jgi:Hydrazine synthase alpha subunit middle domain